MFFFFFFHRVLQLYSFYRCCSANQCSPLRYGTACGYLCGGLVASTYSGGVYNLMWGRGILAGKGHMPEKHIWKSFVIFRKTSCRNTRKASCPKGLDVARFWLQRIFLVYTGPLSSNQPHNYVIVTRLTGWTIRKS